MSAGPNQFQQIYLFIFIPNKQQIGFYVSFPIAFIIAGKLMRLMLFIKPPMPVFSKNRDQFL